MPSVAFGRSVNLQPIVAVRVGLGLLMLFTLFVGRFWWYGGTTSWAGTIRICLLFGLLLALLDYKRIPRQLTSNGLYGCLVVAFGTLLILSSMALGDGKSARRVLLLLGLFVSVPLVAMYSGSAVRYLLGVMAVTSAGVAVFSIVNLWQLGQLSMTYRAGAISHSGFPGLADFENSVLASLEMSFSFVVTLWLLIQARGWWRGLWACCLVAIGAYCFLTYGRTGWLCIAAAGSVLAALLPAHPARKYVYGALVATLMVFTVWFRERIAYELFTRNVTSRDEIWDMVLGLMPGRWLMGWGGDASVEHLLGVQPLGGVPYLVSHPHSVYLEVLFNYGVVGLVVFLAVLAAAFTRLWQARRSPLHRLWLAVLSGSAIGMLFDFSTPVSTPNLLWLWLWLPLAWAFVMPRDEKDIQRSGKAGNTSQGIQGTALPSSLDKSMHRGGL